MTNFLLLQYTLGIKEEIDISRSGQRPSNQEIKNRTKCFKPCGRCFMVYVFYCPCVSSYPGTLKINQFSHKEIIMSQCYVNIRSRLTLTRTRMWMKLFAFVIFSFIDFGESSIQDGGKAPRLLLNDGNSIPAMGLGTFLGFDEKGQKEIKANEVSDAVKWALQGGYRLIDTAALYLNEDQVGKGVAESGVDRENVFVVDKLPKNDQRNVIQSLRNSLEKLNMTYVDLYLIHFPVAFKKDDKTFDVVDYLDTWKSMEEAKSLGLAKSIGISNFNISQMERLIDNCKVKPAVLQVEVNLNLRQDKILEFCKKHGIVVMAYSPFGSLFDKSKGLPPPRADDAGLVKLADKYNKTTPQIVLRYLIQKGVVPIPKSVHKNRIEQNINVFDFKLNEEEVETINKFGENYHRVVWPTYWQDHPYFPFEKSDVTLKNPFEG